MLNIIANCDASYSERTKMAAACSIIMSDLMFHGIITKTYYNVDTGSRAELYGIMQTIEYISHMKDVEHVTLYCDSKSVVKLYSDILEAGQPYQGMSYYEDWVKLLEIGKGLNITPLHSPGHSENLTCNTVCDAVAHSVLKWENT